MIKPKRSNVKAGEIEQIISLLERRWKDTSEVLDKHERIFVEAYVSFLRSIARTALEKGWRVWFQPNQVVHWGEGGFGRLSMLIPAGRVPSFPDFPAEVEFVTDRSDKKRLGEEITLATLDQISYEPDGWL